VSRESIRDSRLPEESLKNGGMLGLEAEELSEEAEESPEEEEESLFDPSE